MVRCIFIATHLFLKLRRVYHSDRIYVISIIKYIQYFISKEVSGFVLILPISILDVWHLLNSISIPCYIFSLSDSSVYFLYVINIVSTIIVVVIETRI